MTKRRGAQRILSIVLMLGLILGMGTVGTGGASAANGVTEITIACSQDSYPFHYQDDSGNAAGINVDYWNLWSKKTGIKVRYLISDWDTTLNNVKGKKADVHAGCFYTTERDGYLDYGFPMVEAETHIFFSRKLPKLDELADLKPYAIGILKGDYAVGYVKSNLPTASIRLFDSYDEMMAASKSGEIQVLVADTMTALFVMQKAGLLDQFDYVKDRPLYTNYFYAAVQEGRGDLLKLIDKGMAEISQSERNAILTKWMPTAVGSQGKVRVAISLDYPPLSYPDEQGDPQGFLIDLWRLWGSKTGTEVEFVAASWAETLNRVATGDADIHSGLFFTDERGKIMDFSNPIYSIESRIFFDSRLNPFKSARDLAGKTVGATRGTYQEAYLREHFPDLKLVTFDYSTSMLEAADNGLIDAFMEESVSVKAQYWTTGRELRMVTLPDATFSRDMLAGVTKAKPGLLKLVNEGLARITRAEWIALEEKWVPDPEDRIYREPVEIPLTPEEKAWIAAHPTLRVGATDDFNPIEYQEDGVHKGIAAEYMNYILGRVGIQTQTVFMLWPDILDSIRNGKGIDATFNVQKTSERSDYMAFSRPYLRVPHVIVTRADRRQINTFQELGGLTVAVERGYYKIDHLEKDPTIELLLTDTPLEALLAVSSGRADAYLGDKITTAHYLEDNALKNLRIREYPDLKTYNISVGTRKDMAILTDIINKVLDTMTETEKRSIISKYTFLTEEGSIYLSEAEGVWLRQHNPVRAGIQGGWRPVEYLDDAGLLAGISSDYISRNESLLNIQMNPLVSPSYRELVEKFKSGKLDIITAAINSPDKSKYMNFTKPYLVSPMVLVTLDDSDFRGNLEGISNERVGVIQETLSEDILKLNHPNVSYKSYAEPDALYKALQNGEIDVLLDAMASVDTSARKLGIANLRISGVTQYSYEICIGIRKDWPEMLTILNRTLDSVSTVEKDSIERYWTSGAASEGINLGRYRNTLLGLGVLAAFIIGSVLFWNRKLQAEINERKAVESALVSAKEAADVANRSKSEFLANMSHEIRTPMNAVIGMTNLLGNTELNFKQRDYVNKIIQAAYNLLNIINDILDFSKIEAGKMDLEVVEFSLDTLLDNVASIIGIRAKDKNVELILNKDSRVPLKLFGDPLRLEQVLINLANNAIKFTDQGEVEVHIRPVKLEDSWVSLEFSVRDTGIGMHSEQLEGLFRPFAQSDTSTTRKYGGTGLGLSISKKLVELMGGRIWAQCQLGGGCTFFFEVTLRYVEGSENTYSEQGRTLGPLKVLVVEDNPAAREVLETYLGDFRFEADCFESGEDALEAVAAERYDLVLMDWKLGGMDGIETARHIREMHLEQNPRILLVTAYGNEEILETIDSEKLDGIVLKPVSESALFNTIHDLFADADKQEKWSMPLKGRLNETFLKDKRILVVEDNAMNQQLARELLQNVGADVEIAGNGRMALEMLEGSEKEYHLIFMDLQMPEMDGFETTQQLRQMERWREVPVIAMTADVMKGVYEQCLANGMNDYVSKPISVDELYERLSFWLGVTEPYYQVTAHRTEERLVIPGLDIRDAVKKLGGNRALLESLLKRFAEAYGAFGTVTQRLLDHGDPDETRRYFHTLKGHAGNIGSQELARMSELAEKYVVQNEEEALKDLLAIMEAAITGLIGTLREKLPKDSAGPLELWTLEDLEEQLKILLAQLRSRKAAAIKDALQALASKDAPEPYFTEMESLVGLCQRYRYKEASELAERLLSKIQGH